VLFAGSLLYSCFSCLLSTLSDSRFDALDFADFDKLAAEDIGGVTSPSVEPKSSALSFRFFDAPCL